MNTVAVVGTQWGDEGKGKIVDLLAADAEIIVRFQGGNNAAHTLVINGEKFILRLVPSGALNGEKVCVIGGGMVVNPFALLEEIENLKKRGVNLDGRLLVSFDAHLVMPYHIAIDRAREAQLGKRAIGTTGFGIGPTYEDKMSRQGLRFDDLIDWASFKDKLERNIKEKNLYLKAVLKTKPIDGKVLLAELQKLRRRLMPYITDTSAYVARATSEGRKILFEGAHGTMLDIDYGTYPFVTSSNCIASAVYAGGGVPPGKLDAVLGISKAYTTRVGAGPFPTEIHGALGDASARGRRGVRQRDRQAAAHRMVRCGPRALRDSGQRTVGPRADEARCSHRHRSAENLRRLQNRQGLLRHDAAGPQRARESEAGLRRNRGMARKAGRRAHSR